MSFLINRAFSAPPLVAPAMKAIVRCLSIALALVLASGASAEDAACTGHASDYKLYVDVQGATSSEGLMAVTLYADVPSKFLMHHGSLYVGRVPARQGTTPVCIYIPKPGVYALAVYQDVNANRKFDRTGIGLPSEPFGFSNNPRVFLGMPAWSAVRLSLPKSGLHTTVRLHQP